MTRARHEKETELALRLRTIRERVPERTYVEHADAWYDAGSRPQRSASRSRRAPLPWILGVVASASAAAAGVAWLAFHSSVPAGDGPARNDSADSTFAGSLAATVGGDPLWSLESPARAFAIGVPLPLGVVLSTSPGRSGVLNIDGRAEVRLEPGAQVLLGGAGADDHSVTLEVGHIAVEARPAARPLRVRLARSGVELAAQAAVFGVLATKSGRWSAAVDRGVLEVTVLGWTARVGEAQLVGGPPAAPAQIRALPDAVALTVSLETSAQGAVVRGLADLLTRIEVDGAEIESDDAGRFIGRVADADAAVRIVATDAAGRTAVRALQPQTSLPTASPASAPRAAAVPRDERRGEKSAESGAVSESAPQSTATKPPAPRGWLAPPQDAGKEMPEKQLRARPLEW